MSYLRNPGFEQGDVSWSRINQAPAVSYGIRSTAGIARSGVNFLSVRSAVEDGSIAQDVIIPGSTPSLSCFAWVRAKAGQVAGTLAMWHLGPDKGVPARFTVGTQWSLVTCTLDFDNASSSRSVRVEFYISTINADLYIDSVNAF